MLSAAVIIRHPGAGPSHKHMPAGGKLAKNGTPPSAKEIVQMYHDNGNKLGVPEMRKYMKTMVAQVFLSDKFSGIHKCRGIWKQQPSDWDPKIPFADPNNAENSQKDNKKPGRGILKEMMAYLVKTFEEREAPKVKKFEAVDFKNDTLSQIIPTADGKENLPPACDMQTIGGDFKLPNIQAPQVQTTDGGNPFAQTSDSTLEAQLEELEYIAAQYAQQPISVANHAMVEQLELSLPVMEDSGTAQQGRVMEETDPFEATMDFGPEFSIVDYITSQQGEEVGGLDVNFNIQMKNESTEISRQVPCANRVEFPPVGTMHQPPPPSNQVAGMPVSNSGEIGGGVGSVLMGGEQGEEAAYYPVLAGQTIPELFPQLDEDMSYTAMMLEHGQHSSMEESNANPPVEETNENIPLTVLDFDTDN